MVCLLLGCGVSGIKAQITIDKMANELEKRDDVAINSVTKRDPKTRKVIKVVLDTMSEVKSGETNFEPSFEEMLEESLKNFNTNERVMGTVLSIAPNEVQVDVGRKQTGFIPASELSNDPNARPEDVVKVGDVIELLIMKTNDQEGTIMLSKRRVDAQKGWEELKEKAESQEVLSGKVTEAVKGGVIVLYNGSRIFIPASQATATREESLEDLVGQDVDFRLIEVSQNGRRRRAIGSIRSVLKEQRAAQREEFWKTCEVGKRYKGVVKSLTSYGAFVDLGGVFGMIHISELSWTHIKHPSEVVNVGDTVDVYIKDINEETKKISLGFKNAEDNPWEILKNNYPEGTVVKATIVGLTTSVAKSPSSTLMIPAYFDARNNLEDASPPMINPTINTRIVVNETITTFVEPTASLILPFLVMRVPLKSKEQNPIAASVSITHVQNPEVCTLIAGVRK